MADAPLLPAALHAPATIAYSLQHFTESDAAFIHDVLNDAERGWAALGYTFVRQPHAATRALAPADLTVRIALLPSKVIERLYPHTQLRGLSICDRRDPRNPIVSISRENWERPPAVSGYANNRRGYHVYVISHEVGHALGRAHMQCPARGAPSPVMMQQTLGVAPCWADPWVVKKP